MSKLLVYGVYNLSSNQLLYVGQTSTSLKQRAYEHSKLSPWFNDKLVFRVLHDNIIEQRVANIVEKHYIREHNLKVTGYNKSSGGSGALLDKPAVLSSNLHTKSEVMPNWVTVIEEEFEGQTSVSIAQIQAALEEAGIKPPGRRVIARAFQMTENKNIVGRFHFDITKRLRDW